MAEILLGIVSLIIGIILKEAVMGGGLYIGREACRVGYINAKKENEKHQFFKN